MEEELKKNELVESLQRIAIAIETLVNETVKERVLKEFEQQKPTIAPQTNEPRCPICNSATKISKSGKSYGCVNAKWKLVDGEFFNSGCAGSVKR